MELIEILFLKFLLKRSLFFNGNATERIFYLKQFNNPFNIFGRQELHCSVFIPLRPVRDSLAHSVLTTNYEFFVHFKAHFMFVIPFALTKG